MYTKIAKIYGKNESSIHEIVEEKGICVSCVVISQTVKVKATVCD